MENNQLNWSKDDFENIQNAWKGDLLDRRRLGEQFTNYVDRLNCGAVLALDARWGEGKMWFVRNWKRHLETTEIPHNVIYLDAFANDYLDDPFLVIASEIAMKLDKTANKKLVHKFKKAAAVMQQGLLTIAPTLIASMISCAITGGIIPFIKIDSAKIEDKLGDAIDKVTDNIGEKVTEAIQNKIETYEDEKTSLFASKSTLTELAESLDQPLVFIIDELDRCRPDFAIRLLERIKHFFDIPKIVFILVMDKTQFSKVVCHNYGYDEKLGEEYLDKFIGLVLQLPRLKIHEKVMIEQFIVKKASDLGLVSDEHKGALGLATLLFLYKKISKRNLEKILFEYAFYSLNNQDLNEFLMYVLFNKKMINDHSNSVKNFFGQVHRELLEIIELYLTEYKYNAYSEIELKHNITMDDKELNEWCYFQVNSNFLEQINIILNDEQKGILDIPELRAHKYHLQKGNSEIDMLESWEVYLHL